MPATPLFELVGVTLAIDDATILHDVSLAIPDAGITVLLGPSGAGKSMLLRLLNRLEVPTAGEVLFRGEPLASIDPLALRRRVGMVFQRPAPFPGTVRDNLLVADPGADDGRLAVALRDAQLDARFLDRSADRLSGGEAQRMCLARTLVTRPEVLLMDEPTAALDPEARRGLERTASLLAEGGRPLVWVTHDLEQARRLAGDLLVLVDGRLADDDERARFLAGDSSADDSSADDSSADDSSAGDSSAGDSSADDSSADDSSAGDSSADGPVARGAAAGDDAAGDARG